MWSGQSAGLALQMAVRHLDAVESGRHSQGPANLLLMKLSTSQVSGEAARPGVRNLVPALVVSCSDIWLFCVAQNLDSTAFVVQLFVEGTDEETV